MTKPATTVAVMTLVDDGRIRLNDDVLTFIPEFEGLGVYAGGTGASIQTTRAGPMTVRDLLTHTAGFSYWFQPGSPVAIPYEEALGAGRFEPWRFDPAAASPRR